MKILYLVFSVCRDYIPIMKILLYLAFLHFWLMTIPLYPQLPNIQFKRFAQNEGLSLNTVYSIIKDHQGFLWFGTSNGLNRYDGYQLRNFLNDPLDSTSISDNWIKCMMVGRNGNIWIGTSNGGLNCYNPKSDVFMQYNHIGEDQGSLPYNDINSLYEDSDGTIWVGTNRNGLYWKENIGKTFNHVIYDALNSSSISENTIKSLLVDTKGNLWVGTIKGLYFSSKKEKYEGKFVQIYVGSGQHSYISSIYETNDGDILVGTGSGLLLRCDGIHKKIDTLYNLNKNAKETRDNSVTCILKDRLKRLWIGTLNNGLRIFNPEGILLYNIRCMAMDPTGLGSNNILSFCEDDAGAIWIGTRDGVSCYDYRQKQFYNVLNQPNNPHSINKGSVQSIYQDDEGDLWIGIHGGGLNYLPRGSDSFKYFLHDKQNPYSISSDFIICMLCKEPGIIWIGTRGGGLNKFDKRTKIFTRFSHDPKNPSSLGDDIINCLDLDSKKNIWIGTSINGIDKLDRSTGKFIHHKNKPDDSSSIRGKTSWSILVDGRDNVWIGTPGDGLNKLDWITNKYTNFINKYGDNRTLSNNYVSSIYEYPQSVFWIGTAGGGLNRYDEKTKIFTKYTTKDGFPDNQIIAITHDLRGRLWMTTPKYVTMFDPQNGSIKNYNESDGIKCGEFGQGSIFTGKDGRIYLGGVNGFVVFHPDSIRDNDYIPPIVLTSFKVFEESRKLPSDSAKGIVLSHEENYFSFEFAALAYTAPEKNMYRYKLEGYDKDWISCGTRRYAAYTQVEAGDYQFRVQGSNNDGIWNNKGISIAVRILPPFWKTIWFQLIAILFVASVITLAVRQRFKFLHQRTRQQQELSRKLLESQEEERKRIGAGLHDSLGQDLLVIKNLLVMGIEANESKENSIARLKQISGLVSQILAEVREISYNLRPYHLDQLGLTGALKSIVNRVASSSNIVFDLYLDDLNNLFPKDQEINIFRIVQETVNNIIKHSHATQADINIKRGKNHVKFYISDNGVGFDKNSKGFGLTSMVERVRILNGTLEIKSELKKGTTIVVIIPLQSNNAR